MMTDNRHLQSAWMWSDVALSLSQGITPSQRHTEMRSYLISYYGQLALFSLIVSAPCLHLPGLPEAGVGHMCF